MIMHNINTKYVTFPQTTEADGDGTLPTAIPIPNPFNQFRLFDCTFSRVLVQEQTPS